MDTPYFVEVSRSIKHDMEYHIKTSEGLVCVAYAFDNARLIVEALNRLALERAVARYT